jgi:hypothetical protein
MYKLWMGFRFNLDTLYKAYGSNLLDIKCSHLSTNLFIVPINMSTVSLHVSAKRTQASVSVTSVRLKPEVEGTKIKFPRFKLQANSFRYFELWHFRFSQRCCWRFRSTGIRLCVSGEWFPTFRRICLYTQGQSENINAPRSFETSGTNWPMTQRRMPQDFRVSFRNVTCWRRTDRQTQRN